MARAGLFDVPCDEPRQAQAGRALRLDLEPQFRGPPGLQGPHPPGLAGNGGGGRNRRAFCRYQGVAVERFRAKWTPVRVKKTRQNKRLKRACFNLEALSKEAVKQLVAN